MFWTLKEEKQNNFWKTLRKKMHFCEGRIRVQLKLNFQKMVWGGVIDGDMGRDKYTPNMILF